ncbi:MAG: peptidoglycan-binding protein [bacterium]
MNRKILIIAGMASLLLANQAGAVSLTTGLSVGSRSEEVKTLQETLKLNPEIYPSGLVTGYYGSATEKAVRQVQKVCKISETGILDETTKKCIYPVDLEIKVTSPNGGEVWDRSQTQTIKWSAIRTYNTGYDYQIFREVSIDLMRLDNGASVCQTNPNGTEYCAIPLRYLFVRHIGTADLFSGWYTWQIPQDIANGSDYAIRIASGPRVITMINAGKADKAITRDYLATVIVNPDYPIFEEDTSDASFSITGTAICPTPVCPKSTCPDYSAILNALEKMMKEMASTIEALRLMMNK